MGQAVLRCGTRTRFRGDRYRSDVQNKGSAGDAEREAVDSRFETCFAGHVRVERLWSGRAGRKVPPASRRAVISSGRTFRTIA
jgi:hypothetical protein